MSLYHLCNNIAKLIILVIAFFCILLSEFRKRRLNILGSRVFALARALNPKGSEAAIPKTSLTYMIPNVIQASI